MTPTAAGASWTFTVAQGGDYTVRVRDAAGNLVKETTATITGGTASQFNWDGKRSDNQPLGTQPYTLELVRGSGASATQVAVTNTGQVTAVDTSTGTARVTVGTQIIPVARITGVTL